jgi:hypothetical protein
MQNAEFLFLILHSTFYLFNWYAYFWENGTCIQTNYLLSS